MGTEELTRGTLGMGLVSLGFIAGLVNQPTQIRTRCAPTVSIVFSEVIAMREWANPNLGIFWVYPELLAFGGPKLSVPPIFFQIIFFAALTPCPI